MEATTSAVEDTLVDKLDFKIKPGASYVTGRRNCSFFATGGNVYSPQTGVRVIRFQLSSDGWLDPSSVRIMYTLQNNDPVQGHFLRPVSGPATFFRRLRVMCGGTVIEDINDWDRLSHMFQILSTDEYTKDSTTEGFGFPIYRDGQPIRQFDMTRGIPGNGKKPVLFKPLRGLFMQEKMLPLRYCNITVELELVNQLTDPIVSVESDEIKVLGIGSVVIVNESIPAGTFSTDWHIFDAQLKCDILTLDSGLENSYAEYLLQGKTIPIPMHVFISQSQALAQSSQETVNITRSLTRLKAMYITFLGAKAKDLRQEYLKTCNNFYSPLCCSFNENELIGIYHSDSTKTFFVAAGSSGQGNVFDGTKMKYERQYERIYEDRNELWYQIQIGSKLYPEYCKIKQ